MLDEFGDCAGMPDTYRGWSISYASHPLPGHPSDWIGISPDYILEWEDESGWTSSGKALNAATREELIAKIDAWILGNGQ